jgi:hypothetical protein
MKALFSKKAKEAPDPMAMVNDPPQEGKPVEAGPPPCFRREKEKVIFPGRMVPMWKPPEPEPAPPEGPDILKLDKIPLGEVKELLQDYAQGRKNPDGIHFAGGRIRVKLQNGDVLEGWLDEVSLKKFRQEGTVRGWRPSPRR